MKRASYYLIICFSYLLFSATTCEEFPEETVPAIFQNECEECIYVLFWGSDAANILTSEQAFKMEEYFTKLQSGEKYVENIPIMDTDMTFYYQFLIFKQSTLNKYTKEELIKKNIYDKLYVLTYEELEKMNFKIVYTGE